MIGELKMRARQVDLLHMTRGAIAVCDFACGRKRFVARCCSRLYCFRAGNMTYQAFGIVRDHTLFQRFVRVMTRLATDPMIVGVTFAFKDSIWLKANVV